MAGPTPKRAASFEDTTTPTRAPVLPTVKIRPIRPGAKPSSRTRYKRKIANSALLKKFDVAVEPAIDRNLASFSTTARPSRRSCQTLVVGFLRSEERRVGKEGRCRWSG